MNPIEFLKGKKTYTLGVGMIALGAAQFTGFVPPGTGGDPGTLILGGLALIFGRDGMNTAAERAARLAGK